VDGKDNIPTDIKVIDFGYAGIWTPERELTGLCGTPDYVAPEILSWYNHSGPAAAPAVEGGVAAGGSVAVRYGKLSDVWSLGVLLYVLLSGCSPFAAAEEEELLKNVSAAEYTFPEKEWAGVSAEAKDLISRTLVADPAKRITLHDCKAHPWCKAAVAQVAAELKATGLLKARVDRAKRDDGRAVGCAPGCAMQ